MKYTFYIKSALTDMPDIEETVEATCKSDAVYTIYKMYENQENWFSMKEIEDHILNDEE